MHGVINELAAYTEIPGFLGIAWRNKCARLVSHVGNARFGRILFYRETKKNYRSVTIFILGTTLNKRVVPGI